MNGRCCGVLAPDRKRSRAAVFLLAACLVLPLSGCSGASLYSTRKEDLQETMKRFHFALMGQDVSSAVRFFPLEDRPEWAKAFTCFFGRYRVVDYRVQEIKSGAKVEEARAVVWVTLHPLKSMTVQEIVWTQEWTYEDKNWMLFPDSESTQAFLGNCYLPHDGRSGTPPP